MAFEDDVKAQLDAIDSGVAPVVVCYGCGGTYFSRVFRVQSPLQVGTLFGRDHLKCAKCGDIYRMNPQTNSLDRQWTG